MAEYNAGGNTGQRYIFTEKERDVESGYDYFGARYYDSDIGRWLSVDPLMDKYPGWSPYNYVMGNTLNSFDPDGRDIIVLHAPTGAKEYGHGAVLIGNEKTGWQYISKDGVKIFDWKMIGPSEYSHEQYGAMSAEEAIGKVLTDFKHVYEEGFRTTSKPDKDALMADAALANAKEWYHVTLNNCIDMVSKALEKGGFHGGYLLVEQSKNVSGKRDFELPVVVVKKYNPLPNERYPVNAKNSKGTNLIISCNDYLI